MKHRAKRVIAILICFVLMVVISPFMNSSTEYYNNNDYIVYADDSYGIPNENWEKLKEAPCKLSEDQLNVVKLLFSKCILAGFSPQAATGLIANVYGESTFYPLACKPVKNKKGKVVDCGVGLFQITDNSYSANGPVQKLSKYCEEHCTAYCKELVHTDTDHGDIYLCNTGEHQIDFEFETILGGMSSCFKTQGSDVKGGYGAYKYFYDDWRKYTPEKIDLNDEFTVTTTSGNEVKFRVKLPPCDTKINSLEDYKKVQNVLEATNIFLWCDERSIAIDYVLHMGSIAYDIDKNHKTYDIAKETEYWYNVPESGEFQSRGYNFANFYKCDENGNPTGNKLKFAYDFANTLGIGSLNIKINNDIIDRGILQSYTNNSLIYSQNSGFILDKSEETIAEMERKNQEVYTDYIYELKELDHTPSKEYGLFELFGEDLHWYRYTGERTYAPTLLDHIWSAWDQDRIGSLISLSTIFYSNTNYLSCHVYKDRCTVLTGQELNNGFTDPRAEIGGAGLFNGYIYTLGSLKMTIAKFLSATMAYLIGPKVFIRIGEIVTWLETIDAWQAFRRIAEFALGLAVIAFIISLVGKARKYSVGKGSGRDALHRFFIGIISIIFVTTFLVSPTLFNNIVVKSATGVDQFFQSLLNEEAKKKNDEVIALSDEGAKNLTTQAVIWRKAIFGPWCRGQFGGLNYEELFTTYAEEDLQEGQSIMPQSHEEVDGEDTTGKAFFNSAKYTGDVYVPYGNGKKARNWADYLYSCGSKYHIDSSLLDNSSEINEELPAAFPIAQTTYNKSDLYADTFRLVDAQMNIAPQEYANGNKIENYTDAKPLEHEYGLQGTIMLLNTALLIFFIPVVFAKFKHFILILIISVQVIYSSIVELFKEDKGLSDYWERFKKSVVAFFVACLRANIMLVLYYKFVDEGLKYALLYCALCVIILGFNVRDIKRAGHSAKLKMRRWRAKRSLNR